MKKEYYYNAKQKVNLSEKICLLRVSVRVQPEKQNQWVGWVGRLTDRWTDRWTGRQADRQKEGGREGRSEGGRKARIFIIKNHLIQLWGWVNKSKICQAGIGKGRSWAGLTVWIWVVVVHISSLLVNLQLYF